MGEYITYDLKRRIVDFLGTEDQWYDNADYERLSDQSRKGRFKASDAPQGKRAPLWSSQGSRAIRFAAQDWQDVPAHYLMNAVKLTLAYDLGVERDLKAEVQNRDLPRIGDDTYRVMKEIAPTNSAAFNGVAVASPRSFQIHGQEGGFALSMRASKAHRVMDQSTVVGLCAERTSSAVDAEPAQAQSGTGFLALFENAHEIETRQNQWECIIVQTPYVGDMLGLSVHMMHGPLNLPPQTGLAFALDSRTVLIAVAHEDLNCARKAFKASHELLAAIQSGKTGDFTPEEFLAVKLAEGADIKYIDPKMAAQGRGFVDLMHSHQAFEMLQAMQKFHGGIMSHEDRQYLPPQAG